MNELLVVKSPQFLHRDSTGFSFYTEEVVGITDDGRTLTKYGYKPSSGDFEDSISLAQGQPDRVTEAFERTAASIPGLKDYINCHMFVYFALGRAKHLKQQKHYPGVALASTSYDTLSAGVPYSTVLPNGVISHSLLGVGASDESLSVLGDNGILAVMKNDTLAKLYEADQMVEMSLGVIDK